MKPPPTAPGEPDPADATLAARVGHGDGAAMALLIARHEGALLRLTRRVTGNAASAHDVVQDVWLKLWTRADRYDARRGRFSAWVKRVAVHSAIDWRRRAGRSGPQDAPEPAAAEHLAPDQQATQAEIGARVRQAVAALPVRQREAVVHCYFAGLTAPQAAERMGLSLAAVEALLVRARRTLRKALRETLAPQETP